MHARKIGVESFEKLSREGKLKRKKERKKEKIYNRKVKKEKNI
jgi:hypothetical protein